MFIEMLITIMVMALGLLGLYIKLLHKSAAPSGVRSRYRNYRKERRETFLSLLRQAVLKGPYIDSSENEVGLYPSRAMLL